MRTALLLASALLVVQETSEKPACCADPAAPLQPLPEDATEKEKWLRRLHDEACRQPGNVYLLARDGESFREKLAHLREDAPLTERFGARWSLAQACMRTGALEEAIELLEVCVRLCEASPRETKNWLPEVLFRLASAHF